jgi:hypothetical protein
MEKIIKINDIKELALKIALEKNQDKFKPESIERAVNLLSKDNLRYNNVTGKIYCNRFGLIEKYTNQKDFIPHVNIEDICIWEFSRHIFNQTSMIERGYID